MSVSQGQSFEPPGIRFYDRNRRQEMILVTEGDWKEWLCYRHPDGQWVSLRKATVADLRELAGAGILDPAYGTRFQGYALPGELER